MEGQAEKITPAMAKVEMKPSPALSLVTKAPKTIEGRRIGVLVTDGTQASFVAALRRSVEKAGAQLQVVAPKIGGAAGAGGRIDADHQVAGGPSVLFDAVVVAPSEAGAQLLERDAAAIDWIRDSRSVDEPAAEYTLWVFPSRALDPAHIPPAFARGIQRWTSAAPSGSTLVQNITHVILVDPDGQPHAIAPATVGAGNTPDPNADPKANPS